MDIDTKPICKFFPAAGILVLAVFVLFGCHVPKQPMPTTTKGEQTNNRNIGLDTKGQLIEIRSDNVSRASYDAETETLVILFKTGAKYWYSPVPQSTWHEFYLAQPHPWSEVGYPKLVLAKIPHGRIE